MLDRWFLRGDPGASVRAPAELIAVTQQFGFPWSEIPHGWKTLAVLRFEADPPATVRALDEIGSWTFSHRVCLAQESAWRAIARAASEGRWP